jgi:predicted lipoprotein with Yx(FWY)xxD motif
MNYLKRFLPLLILAVLAACSSTPPASDTEAVKFAVFVLNTSENTASTLAATPWTLETLAGEDVKGAGRSVVGDALISERVHTMNVTAKPGDLLTLNVTTNEGQVAVGPFELFSKDGQPLDGEVLNQNGLSVVADPTSSEETSLEASSVRVTAFGSIQLSGAAEVPPVATDASGQAAALLINKVAFVIGRFQELQGDLLPSHVHRGAVGQNGPIVFDLKLVDTSSSDGFFVGYSRLSQEDAELFKKGELYLNIHSSFSRTGEIRGQIAGAAPAKKDIKLGVANSETFGDYVTDSAGNSLYLFTKDTRGANSSACNGPCAQNFPPLTFDAAKEILKVDESRGMNPSLLGSFKREDGTTQATYNGWPLYRFSKDTAPGNTNGQGVGGVWFLVSPDGKGIREALPVTFTATLNGANEVPAITTDGTGSVTATLSGTTLTLNGNYTYLSGPATLAHIHGPAAKTEAAGVLFNLTFTNEGNPGSGKLSATLTLTPEQVAQLKDGLYYVNVHTAANKAGEIRGQLEVK